MKKINIIIFVVMVIVIAGIVGYAMWDADKSLNEFNESVNSEILNKVNEQAGSNEASENVTDVVTNEVTTNELTTTINYVGDWYISEEAYRNAERIDEIMDRHEDLEITDEDFERQMQSEINTNIVELDVERYVQNNIKFDFILISPAPTQREGRLDDIQVNLEGNTGTFTYQDNWGTGGNGTITLNENSITLKLETTSAAQGALWGVEGIYTFSYKRED